MRTFFRFAIALCLSALLCGCVRGRLGPQFNAVTPRSEALSVTLAWNPNTESTLAGYNLYYGTASRAYSGKVAVGTVTNATVPNLQKGQTYFFSVTATNTAGLESGYSNEVQWPPVTTNIIHISSVWVTNILQTTGVTNWSISLTNPPGTRYYRHDIRRESLP